MKYLLEVWEIEMWKNIGTIENPVMSWVKEKRFYYAVKNKSDFDLHDIDGLRKNATFLHFMPQRQFKPA